MENAIWSSPEVQVGAATVQSHIVPRDGDGVQGFFVYQQERLVAAGGWLGLKVGKRIGEMSNYVARIRIDLPADVCGEWELDIDNATATPAKAIAIRLNRLAKDTIRRSHLEYNEHGSVQAF